MWFIIIVSTLAGVLIGKLLIGMYRHHREWQNSPEQLEITSELLDAQIARNSEIISRLHLDIFHGVPEKNDDLFALIMDKFASRPDKKKCYRWEIPENTWSRIRLMREPNGAYLLNVPNVEVLKPPDYAQTYYLLGMSIRVSPDIQKFDLVPCQ